MRTSARSAISSGFTSAWLTGRSTGISPKRSPLWLIDDHPGVAQTGLAQRMRMDRATTMAIVNRLEAKGYLLRRKSRSDGRKQALNLTDRGRKALSMAKRAIHQHEQWLKSRFTDKEVAKLIELLTRIHD
jgi:DNA-binding MarR family transcriptional regulator